jgi:hypothetical protein
LGLIPLPAITSFVVSHIFSHMRSIFYSTHPG